MNQSENNSHSRDEQFVHDIRSGGPKGEKAILDLYTEYRKVVKSTIREVMALYPACRSEANDLLHDAFIVIILKIQSGKLRDSSLKAFWIGIARKLIQNNAKKYDRILLVREPEETYGQLEISPEEIYLITERNHEIEDRLAQFGGRCKDVLLLWMSHYSMHEIATRLDLSSARMARKLKHICFRKLKHFIAGGNEFHPEDMTY